MPRPGYAGVLRDRSFQALSLANFVSLAGDQIARVALSVLVYDRTSSAALTGLTYALSYLPSVVGGPLLAGLADRRPRRSVMVWCDLLRAVLVLLMAIPGMPLPLLLVLLAVVTLCESPFDAARGAMMPDVLPGERYAIGGAIDQVVLQAAMVVGFAAGGALLVFATPRELLALDAMTFVVSAALVRAVPFGLTRLELDPDEKATPLTDLRVAGRLVFGDRVLRPLVLVAWLYERRRRGARGAWLCRTPTGSGAGLRSRRLVVGRESRRERVAGLLLPELPESRRVPLLWPLATLAAAPLVVCLVHPPFWLVVGLVAVSGMGTSYHLVAMVRFVTLVPPEKRGRALGLAGYRALGRAGSRDCPRRRAG